MILQYLKLQNIRSYVNEKIDFPTGSVLLSGDIGSGKSTILLGIEFALFGIKRGTYSGSNLLRNGEQKGSVELKFLLKSGNISKQVLIHRSLKRTQNSIKQDSGFLIIDGERTEGTPVELRAKILDLLGYPNVLVSKSKDLIYRYTVYTPQDEMKQILFSDKEERLDTLRRVFNIDKYKRIRENVGILQRQLRETMKEFEGRVFSLPDKTKQYKEIIKQANEISKTVKELLPTLRLKKEAIEAKKTKLTSILEKITTLSELKVKQESLQSQIIIVQEQKDLASKEMKQVKQFIEKTKAKANLIKTIQLSKQDVEILEREVEQKTKSLDEIKHNNAILREKIVGLKEQIAILTKETRSKREAEKLVIEKRQELKNHEVVLNQKAELEKNMKKIELIIEKLQNKITECGVNFANAQQKISDVSGISKCPTCHQEVTDKYRKEIVKLEKQTMKELKSEKKEHEERLAGYKLRLEQTKENLLVLLEKEKQIERLKAELSALEVSFKEFGAKKQRLSELQEKLPFFEKKIITKEIIAEQEKQLKLLKSKYKETQETFSKQTEKQLLLDSIAEKEFRIKELQTLQTSLSKKITAFEDLIKQIKEQVTPFTQLEKKRDTIKKELTELETLFQKMQSEKSSLLSKREVLIASKNALEREIIVMREIKQKMNIISELKEWLQQYFTKLTLVMEKHIMMRVYNEFNALFREWFSMLIEDDVISVRLDDEFTPVVEQNGFETSIENLSGGEKTSCALAYRLALNRVINDCIDSIKTSDLIILDEPTDGFSTEQLDHLREVIDQLQIAQIIIVSHEQKIESFVTSTIRINKLEHVSSVV